MGKKKEFEKGSLYTITNYIWCFLLGNFYFTITNILFIISWLSISPKGIPSFNILTVISLLPAGPALVALLSAMGKLVRERDIDMTKDFFKAYRKNFFEALFYWTILLIILSIFYIDIIYFNTNIKFKPVKNVLLMAAFLIISMAFYVFPIISRFYLRIKDVLKISFYYTIKKIHITILNLVCLGGLSYISMKTSSPILFCFFWSVFCFLIMFNEKVVLAEIEEKYVSSKGKNQSSR